MSTTFRRTVLVALLTLGLAACGDATGSGDPADSSVEEPADPMDPTGSWVMIDGPMAPIDGWDVTVTIGGDQIGGTAACNSYGGSVTWSDDGAISVGELAQTEMACEPAEVMDLEQAFLTSLARADAFAVDGSVLTLRSGGDAWTFEELPPAPTAELVGTTWQLDGYVANDAVSNETGMEAATLTLHADGTLSGSTNCRQLSGTWTESGAEILFTQLEAEGECPDEAAADLDGRILQVLGDGFTVAIDGGQLTITSQGGVGLTFTAA
jgi:heat shock protein HslJ